MKNRFRKYSIVFCIFLSLMFLLSACGSEEQAEIDSSALAESEYIELSSADEVFDGEAYVNKKVKVKGSLNYADAASGDMKMYGDLSGMEIYLVGSGEYEMPASWCAIITGVVKSDEYGGKLIEVDSLEPCMDENCRHNVIAEENANYTPSTEEIKGLCNQVSWEELARYPDSYIGQYVKMTGIITSPGDTSLLVATRVENGMFYEDYVWVEFDSSNSSTRFLEEDRVTFYGTANGLKSYTTVAGGSKTVPLIQAAVVEFAQ